VLYTNKPVSQWSLDDFHELQHDVIEGNANRLARCSDRCGAVLFDEVGSGMLYRHKGPGVELLLLHAPECRFHGHE